MDKADLIEKIRAKVAELQPVLEACRINLPTMPENPREKRLQEAYDKLNQFEKSEAVAIFKAAEALRPPGVLASWANDVLLRGAREVQIYIKAVNLVRATWRESGLLPQFFRRRTDGASRREGRAGGSGSCETIPDAASTRRTLPGTHD